MQTVRNFLTVDHHRCDELFAAAEAAAQQEDWVACELDFQGFHSAMKNHFLMEEQVLFPQIEELNGQPIGPEPMMLMEHEQMRELFEQMEESVEQKDVEGYLGASETLLVFMQQHNMKEEQILYEMADSILGETSPEVVHGMEKVSGA
ncbi:MAG: hemerythrin domain-containing protein [Gammaproteobacteria bacterium]|nr:hemerythrin domain-containing protein [Gammaproteobacteria bacterium]